MSLRFNVADLAAIETRVGAWLAGCVDLNAVFEPYTDIFGEYQRNGKDPYISFATKMYGLQYDQLYADFKGKNGKDRKAAAKRMRQVAKPGVLGAIYRLSGGAVVFLHTTKCKEEHRAVKGFYVCENNCPKGKSGLWDYADKMGVEMTMKQAHEVVDIFRNSYPEICSMERSAPGVWKRLEDAVADVMHPDHPNTVRYIGPNNAVKIDKINLGRHENGRFIKERESVMRMQLPSGRYLHYLDAHLAPTKMPWMGEDEDGEPVEVFRDALIYAGTNQKTKQWETSVNTHGGKLFENLVQGIARDVLAAKMLEIEALDPGSTVGHVHDEQICVVEDDILSPNVDSMVEIMSQPISWASGLLLGADGFQSAFYHK